MPFILLGEGKQAEARDSVNLIPPGVLFGRDLLEACLNPGQGNRLDSATKDLESVLKREPDPENHYVSGTLLAYCGQKDAVVRVITSAITQNYCAYDALQRDPLLAKFRDSPEFTHLLSAAKTCQNDFLAKSGQGRP